MTAGANLFPISARPLTAIITSRVRRVYSSCKQNASSHFYSRKFRQEALAVSANYRSLACTASKFYKTNSSFYPGLAIESGYFAI